MLIRAVHVSTSLLSTIGSGFFQFLFECEGVVGVGGWGWDCNVHVVSKDIGSFYQLS